MHDRKGVDAVSAIAAQYGLAILNLCTAHCFKWGLAFGTFGNAKGAEFSVHDLGPETVAERIKNRFERCLAGRCV